MIVRFIDHNDHVTITEVNGQPSLMRLAVEAGVSGIAAECGGVLACATCHVIIDDSWIDQLPPPTEIEGEMLNCLDERHAGSRLSCQVKLESSWDGMVVHVPESQF